MRKLGKNQLGMIRLLAREGGLYAHAMNKNGVVCLESLVRRGLARRDRSSNLTVYTLITEFEVTDDILDAPDGSKVGGYERRGDTWYWRGFDDLGRPL